MDQSHRQPLERSSTGSKERPSSIDHAAMPHNVIVARLRGGTSLEAGASRDSVITIPDSEAERREIFPQEQEDISRRTEEKNLLEKEINEQFGLYTRHKNLLEEYYDSYGGLKYKFPEEARKQVEEIMQRSIGNTSFIYQESEKPKQLLLSIKGNLQNFNTISETDAQNVRRFIKTRMHEYKEFVRALGMLADNLDHENPPDELSSGSSME